MENSTNYVMIRGTPKLEISLGYGENGTVTLRMQPALDYSAAVMVHTKRTFRCNSVQVQRKS
jgi:hypothetical protein